MENASKALLIAAGVLIAMMIAGILVYSRVEWGEYQEAQDKAKLMEQTAEFNQKFESYNKKVITGFQMISLTNLVNDYNTSVKNTGYEEIVLDVKWFDLIENQGASRNLKPISPEDIAAFGNQDYDTNQKKKFKQKYFTCKGIEYDSSTGRVKKMSYDEITKK